MKSLYSFVLCFALSSSFIPVNNADLTTETYATAPGDVILDINTGDFYACPRCRRAQPPGPRKKPSPSDSLA